MQDKRFSALKIAVAASLPLASGLGMATTPADLGLSPGQVSYLEAIVNAPVTPPGLALGSPVGFGASWGEVGIAVGGATIPRGSSRNSNHYDESTSVLFGLGDAQKYVGLETLVNLNSFTNFGSDGSLSFKLHTALPGYRAAVAFGVENVARWGAAKTGESSGYVVGTKFVDVGRLPLALNLGFGNGNSSTQFTGPHRSDSTKVTPFGGFALYVHPQVSLITDWTGYSLNSGVSVVPLKRVPVVITLGASNVTGRNVSSSDTKAQFIGGIGLNLKF